MKANTRIQFKYKLLYVAVVSSLGVGVAQANPSGGTVVNGSASIAASGNVLTITNSPNAIINWQQFSIGSGETTRFLQQSASSAVLNRVVGNDLSSILGTLQSNGKVLLINPNGIVFGQGAIINTAGLVASTLNISDADFLAGKMRFNADRLDPGKVSNAGEIKTPNGGFVYLIAPDVENSGVINTPSGQTVLAAGYSVELVDSADPSLSVMVSSKSQDVNLSQLMTQNNGKVFNILNSGKVSANTAVQGENGRIYFSSAGDIRTTDTSVVEAAGDVGKDGGRIRSFADGAAVYRGNFDVSGANGGFIETSGKTLDFAGVSGTAKALSPSGRTGDWLFDPFDLTIDATDAATIQTALGGANVTLTVTGTGCTGGAGNCGPGNGDILWQPSASISSNSAYDLTLSAVRNISLGSNISLNNSNAVLTLNAGSGTVSGVGTLKAGKLAVAAGDSIGTSGSPLLTKVPTLAATSTNGSIYISNNADGGTLDVHTVGTQNGLSLGGTTAGRTISLTETNGNVNVNKDINADNGVVDITLSKAGATYDPQSNAMIKGMGGVTVTTDIIMLTGSTTVGGSVVLQPYTAGQVINLGSSGNAHFDLSAGELSSVSATSLQIGSSASTGDIQIVGDIDNLVSGNPVFSTLSLISQGNFIQNSGQNINIKNGTLNLLSGGNVTVDGAISAANVAMQAGVGKNLTIGTDGSIVATGAGNSVVLAADSGVFANNATVGTNAINAGTGRFLIYSANPTGIVKGGLTSNFRHYAGTYATYAPGSVAEAGNGFIYASAAGNLSVNTTLTSGSANQVYGNAPNAVYGYNLTGFADTEDTAANIGLGGSATSNAPTVASHAGGYTVSYNNGLTSTSGYSFAAGAGLGYTVNASPLTVSLTNTGVTKPYDGNTALAFTPSYNVSGLVGSDVASFTVTSKDFNTSHVATADRVGVSGLALSGIVGGTGLLGDYTLSGATTASSAASTASITQAALTVSLTNTGVTKPYDGNTASAFTPSYNVSGLVGSDVANFTVTSKDFNTSHVATADRVGVSGLALSGIVGGTGLLGDYTLSGATTASSAASTASITQAALTVTANAYSKTYDGLAYSGGNGVTYAGFVPSEGFGNLGGSLSYGGSSQGAINAGTYIITPSGYISGDYNISYLNSLLTVNPAFTGTPVIPATTQSAVVTFSANQLSRGADAISDPAVVGGGIIYKNKNKTNNKRECS